MSGRIQIHATATQNIKAATDPAVQQVYGYLAAAEEKHYEFLEKHHKYLESNGGWAFFEIERPMFEG